MSLFFGSLLSNVSLRTSSISFLTSLKLGRVPKDIFLTLVAYISLTSHMARNFNEFISLGGPNQRILSPVATLGISTMSQLASFMLTRLLEASCLSLVAHTSLR